MKQPAVYLLASRYRGTLYVGVTSDLVQRIWQHRQGLVEGFTQRYGVMQEEVSSAIALSTALALITLPVVLVLAQFFMH